MVHRNQIYIGQVEKCAPPLHQNILFPTYFLEILQSLLKHTKLFSELSTFYISIYFYGFINFT